MKLTDSVIRSITKGAVEIVQNEGFLCFYRFTKEVLSYYSNQSDGARIRSRSSSGVRFDFYTDAEKISISYCLFPGSSQTRGAFDFWVNGELYAHEGENLVDGEKRRIDVALPSGEKRLTVYFPTLAETKITSVELSDGASVVPCEDKDVCLFFGDSITQGYVTDFPSLCYPPLYSSLAGVDFYNFGVGADVFNAEVLKNSVPCTPKIVFTAYGTNDWGARKSIHSFKYYVNEYYTELLKKYPNSRIVAILPIWRGDNAKTTGVGTFEEMYEAYREVLNDFDRVEVVSGLELMPHIKDLHFDKYLHPNEQGFSYYAKNLFNKTSM